MPRVDMVYNMDLANQNCCGGSAKNAKTTAGECNCDNGVYWMPPPPPPMEYPLPYPPYPPYPAPLPPRKPCDYEETEVTVKKSSIEGKICKLSKKAATINRMIANLEDKEKDFIMKAGDTSYNFGNVKLTFADDFQNYTIGEDAENYADTALLILNYELNIIKTQIKELSEQLGEEIDSTGSSGTTGGNDP